MQTHPDDDVFRALADKRRRSVIRYLANETEGTATYWEVADHVASCDPERSAEALVALRHTTLPALEDADLLRYDPERERIRYRPNGLVEDVLNAVEGG